MQLKKETISSNISFIKTLFITLSFFAIAFSCYMFVQNISNQKIQKTSQKLLFNSNNKTTYSIVPLNKIPRTSIHMKVDVELASNSNDQIFNILYSFELTSENEFDNIKTVPMKKGKEIWTIFDWKSNIYDNLYIKVNRNKCDTKDHVCVIVYTNTLHNGFFYPYYYMFFLSISVCFLIAYEFYIFKNNIFTTNNHFYSVQIVLFCLVSWIPVDCFSEKYKYFKITMSIFNFGFFILKEFISLHLKSSLKMYNFITLGMNIFTTLMYIYICFLSYVFSENDWKQMFDIGFHIFVILSVIWGYFCVNEKLKKLRNDKPYEFTFLISFLVSFGTLFIKDHKLSQLILDTGILFNCLMNLFLDIPILQGKAEYELLEQNKI